jgi:hypothetical protein
VLVIRQALESLWYGPLGVKGELPRKVLRCLEAKKGDAGHSSCADSDTFEELTESVDPQ